MAEAGLWESRTGLGKQLEGPACSLGSSISPPTPRLLPWSSGAPLRCSRLCTAFHRLLSPQNPRPCSHSPPLSPTLLQGPLLRSCPHSGLDCVHSIRAGSGPTEETTSLNQPPLSSLIHSLASTRSPLLPLSPIVLSVPHSPPPAFVALWEPLCFSQNLSTGQDRQAGRLFLPQARDLVGRGHPGLPGQHLGIHPDGLCESHSPGAGQALSEWSP